MQRKHGVRPAHASGVAPGDGLVHTPRRAPSSLHTSAARSHTVTGSDVVPDGLLCSDDSDDEHAPTQSTRMTAAARTRGPIDTDRVLRPPRAFPVKKGPTNLA